MIIILNPNEKVRFIGLIEGASGFGSIGGPILGSILYSFFGFLNMFLLVGFLHLIFIPLLKYKMPAHIDQNDDSILNLTEHQDEYEEEAKGAAENNYMSNSDPKSDQNFNVEPSQEPEI